MFKVKNKDTIIYNLKIKPYTYYKKLSLKLKYKKGMIINNE